jgi:hypothetical protein
MHPPLSFADLNVRRDETDTLALQRFRDNWELLANELAAYAGIPEKESPRGPGRPRGRTGVPEARELLEAVRRVGLPPEFDGTESLENRTSKLLMALGCHMNRMPAPYDLAPDPAPWFGPRAPRYSSRAAYDRDLLDWQTSQRKKFDKLLREPGRGR